MIKDWFYILLVVVAYVTIIAESENIRKRRQAGGNTTAGNTTGNATDDDEDEPEPHKDLRCYSCNWNVTKLCGDPFDRNDPEVRTQICPNHTMCYVGFEYDWYTVVGGSRGCIYDADGKQDYSKYFHFYCTFDLCNGAIRALKFVPFFLLAIIFLRYPPTNIL